MTDKQPEALRLADILQHKIPSIECLEIAAAELRRLHEVNAELVEALEHAQATEPIWKTPIREAKETLRARLAKPEPKPVAYRVWSRMGGISFRQTKPSEDEYVEWDALYVTSPHHEWVWLTDEEIFEIWMKSPAETEDRFAFVKAVIAKLREKNT